MCWYGCGAVQCARRVQTQVKFGRQTKASKTPTAPGKRGRWWREEKRGASCRSQVVLAHLQLRGWASGVCRKEKKDDSRSGSLFADCSGTKTPSAPREQGRWLREERRKRRGRGESKFGGGRRCCHTIRYGVPDRVFAPASKTQQKKSGVGRQVVAHGPPRGQKRSSRRW